MNHFKYLTEHIATAPRHSASFHHISVKDVPYV
jgi:hypothetical protein